MRGRSNWRYTCPACGHKSATFFTHIIRCGVEDCRVDGATTNLPVGPQVALRHLGGPVALSHGDER